MTDEQKRIVQDMREWYEVFRKRGKGGERSVKAFMEAADLIEKLSAQLVNQATEYSRALKIATEQRDRLLGTQDKLAALLSYVTGGRFSKTSYSIDEMERFVDDYQQSECAKCDEFEQVKAERDRYWQYIKDLGCDSCGGDCDRCEVGLDGVWSGWVWLPKEAKA